VLTEFVRTCYALAVSSYEYGNKLFDSCEEGITVIPRLAKIIRSGITFVSRNLR